MIKLKLKRLLRYLEFFSIKRVVGMLALLLVAFGLITTFFVMTGNVAVLNPGGIVAEKEKDLIIFTVLLSMVVIIPVFIMLFAFAWRYRDGNKKRTAKYTPDVGGSKLLEVLWWGIPIIIIGILSVVTWISTHDLDPHKELESDKKAITIQVVALEWKWLFIYPEQQVASINEVRFPENTPVNFEITADAPMSAFWIPNLGSQIYAMKGMTTKLSLMADATGEYYGTNTNINGEGYSKMTFKAVATTDEEFTDWLADKELFADNHLNWERYLELVKPTMNDGVTYFHIHDTTMHDQIVNQYMGHGGSDSSHDMMEAMEGM